MGGGRVNKEGSIARPFKQGVEKHVIKRAGIAYYMPIAALSQYGKSGGSRTGFSVVSAKAAVNDPE